MFKFGAFGFDVVDALEDGGALLGDGLGAEGLGAVGCVGVEGGGRHVGRLEHTLLASTSSRRARAGAQGRDVRGHDDPLLHVAEGPTGSLPAALPLFLPRVLLLLLLHLLRSCLEISLA